MFNEILKVYEKVLKEQIDNYNTIKALENDPNRLYFFKSYHSTQKKTYTIIKSDENDFTKTLLGPEVIFNIDVFLKNDKIECNLVFNKFYKNLLNDQFEFQSQDDVYVIKIYDENQLTNIFNNILLCLDKNKRG